MGNWPYHGSGLTMTTIHCKPNDPAVAAILARTWPGTSHRDIGVTIYETGGMPLTSCWDGGRRDIHRVLRLADMQTFQIPANGNGFEAADHAFGPAGFPLSLPAPGFAVVTLVVMPAETVMISAEVTV